MPHPGHTGRNFFLARRRELHPGCRTEPNILCKVCINTCSRSILLEDSFDRSSSSLLLTLIDFEPRTERFQIQDRLECGEKKKKIGRSESLSRISSDEDDDYSLDREHGSFLEADLE